MGLPTSEKALSRVATALAYVALSSEEKETLAMREIDCRQEVRGGSSVSRGDLAKVCIAGRRRLVESSNLQDDAAEIEILREPCLECRVVRGARATVDPRRKRRRKRGRV